jgi:hypothetical protein
VIGIKLDEEEIALLRERLAPRQTISSLIRAALGLPEARPAGRRPGPVAKPYNPRKAKEKDEIILCWIKGCNEPIPASMLFKHLRSHHSQT